ncbi:MAG: HAMP domain-containing protein, partial [Spirochaetia bacterium]|nr:HAMP domain-containing protein [Spirochaetia bacterium]
MIQDRYAFNNLYPIYTSPALESILSDLSNIRMGEATRRWNIRGIHYLFILASNESREDIKKFMGNLIEKGIGIVFIPETIARFNHEKLFHIHQILKNKLRNGSAEFLYESGMEEDAGNFLNGFSIFQLFESASNGDFLSRIRTEENQHLSNYVLYLKSAVKNGMFLLSEMPDQQLLIEGSEEEKTAETSKDVKKSGKQIFKPSRFTIKIKMMGMISSIILTALSVVIFLASNFFRDASERRVQQTDLAITEIIGQRIEAEIKTIQLNSKTFISSISGAEIAPLKARELSDIFFKSNDEYIFIGVAENQEGQTVFTKQFRNNTFLLKKEIPSSDIDQLHALNSNAFQRVFNGTTLIHNASPGFKIPIIGIGIPYKENIIIVYMDPKNFLNTFKKTGMSTTYMVDDRGFVIAHPDKKIVQSKTNFIELPIVKKAFDSSIPNGQFKYKDKYKDEEKVSYLGSFKRLKIVPLFVISTVPEKEALKEVFDIQRRNIYIMALVLNAALLIVFFYSRSLSIPLIRLVGATKKIEEGDYVVDIKPSSRDEVGILTNSFLTMALGLGEREKMKDALGRFVNKQIAEKVLKG